MKYILHPHAQSITKVLSSLHSSQSGLTNVQVVRRKKDNKLNVLPSSNQFISSLSLLFSQLKSPLIILLIIAGIVSGSLGEIIDMSVILGTAGINILVGFFQEYKANSAIRELQKMVQQYAIVLRDKKKLRIDISEIVTGDIVYVEAGNSIPGDGRVIESSYLEVDESSLTGESISIKKHTKVLPMNIQYTDQKNMVFKGTKVTAGNGYIVITAIGQQTILGGIATLVSEVSEGFTPLQKQVNKLSVFIGYVVIGIAIMIFFLGILTNNSGTYTALQLFETAVAVAIAAIPEGLAISLTIILAIGMKFIAKKKALVRRLVAAETLGSVNVICTDKTGTITEGKMRVEFFEFDSQKVSSEQLDQLTIDTIEEGSNMQYALQIGALANTAVYEANLEQYLGDTTDVAFAALSFQLGYAKERLETLYPIVDTIPFSSETKYIGSLHKFKRQHTLFIKGATEILLGNSTHILRNGKKISITENNKKYFLDLVSKYSSQGYRIIGLAYKQFDHKKTSKIIVEDLVFVGLAVLSDPVRKGVAEILVKTSTAGIKTIMITGDYANTALSIAKQIGLPHQANNIIAGEQLESMTDKELIACIDNIYIFARANPNHKIRIVKALQSKGNVVAMTGDGVNDAPAIKAADIGIAVGSGTDVAKQTADIILLDDSLITIVETIEQGRGIYENIQKVILYLLVGSFAEVILISTSLFLGMPLAALPVQILWINVIAETFPNIALAFDKGDKDNMSLPPRDPDVGLITKQMKIMIIAKSFFGNILLVSIFMYTYKTTNDIVLARTLMFVGFSVDAIFSIFSIRHLQHMIWTRSLIDNKYILASVALVVVLLTSAIYVPVLQMILQTKSIGIQYWLLMIAFGILNLVFLEITKFFTKKTKPKLHPVFIN